MNSPFEQMSLPGSLLEALKKMNFVQPTPIQEAAIPVVLEGRDLIGCAQTGTGKTGAFGIPLVARLMAKPNSGALILAPTRELALQISDVLQKLLSQHRQIRTVLLIGGVDMGKQIRDLRQSPGIIIATPGRLSDHLRRRTVNLSKVDMVVLDEGDRMLDMGFEPQINDILKSVNPDRQMLLFSATLPPKIKKLSERYLKNPAFVKVGESSPPIDRIRHLLVPVEKSKRKEVLLDHLNARAGSVLIFVNTQHGTNRLSDYLEEFGFPVTKIHGGRTQGQRNQALLGFRSGKFRIMVATDVAARGLDVPQIEHVINFDLPKDIDDYVHRIGRTARAGAEGEAICYLGNEDRNLWNRIARTYRLEMMAGAAPSSRPSQPRAESGGGAGGGGGHSRPRRSSGGPSRWNDSSPRSPAQGRVGFGGRKSRFRD